MTKDEFINRYETNRDMIINHFDKKDDEHYSYMIYMMASMIFNITYMEELVEKLGYTTKRRQLSDKWTCVSDIYHNDEQIGVISCLVYPEIMMYKGHKGISKEISKDVNALVPIEGHHRILDWHDVEDKLHLLAGGEIVIHFLPLELSIEKVEKFVNNTKLDQILTKIHGNI